VILLMPSGGLVWDGAAREGVALRCGEVLGVWPRADKVEA